MLRYKYELRSQETVMWPLAVLKLMGNRDHSRISKELRVSWTATNESQRAIWHQSICWWTSTWTHECSVDERSHGNDKYLRQKSRKKHQYPCGSSTKRRIGIFDASGFELPYSMRALQSVSNMQSDLHAHKRVYRQAKYALEWHAHEVCTTSS